MTDRRRARIALPALVAWALLAPTPARPHEFKLESVMSGFVEIEPHEAHLVVRVPLHMIRSAHFPLAGREIALAEAGPAVRRALDSLGADIELREEGRPLVPSGAAGRLSLPSDRSFERYQDAVDHVARAPDPGTAIYFDQGYFDAHFTYAIGSPRSRFAIRTAVAPELGTLAKLAFRYLPPGGPERAMVITSRSGLVALDPTWYQAAGGFTALGIAHILSGVDHLLFLLCLVIPLVGLRQVIPVVTAFTAAHSLTLIGSAYGLAPGGAWFPPFVETAIAASILYMALENIAGARLGHRWLVTGLFGLVHGFGFSYALRESLQFAGGHLLLSLFSFNVGIEVGQLAVLAALLPALAALRRLVRAERAWVIILSAIVGHTAWHWMVERGEVLWKMDWPRLDAAAAAALARWAAGLLLGAAAVRLAAKRGGAVLSRLSRRRASAE